MTELRPLGRIVQHDPRSRAYAFKAARSASYHTVRHESFIGTLDQGNLGACTGYATVGVVGSEPFFGTLPDSLKHLDAEDAIDVYSRATTLDPFDGSWPPDDTGSSGLAAAKAAQSFGLISGYQHAFSLEDALAAVMKTPVITGFYWYSSFDEPDQTGKVDITSDAYVRGGHEVFVDGFDPDKGLVWFRNSWGYYYGLNGRFCMPLSTWAQLLNDQGDATIFVPLTSPAPTPVYSEDDLKLVAAMEPWSKTIISQITKAGKAKAAYLTWKKAKGIL